MVDLLLAHEVCRVPALLVDPLHQRTWFTPGSLRMEDIRKAIRAHAAEYRACFEAELRADQTDPTGVMKLHFRIDADGQVGGALVLPGEFDHRPALSRCMLDALMGWRFPPVPSGGIVIVVYPFRFQVTP